MTRAVLIPVDGSPRLVDIPGVDVDRVVFNYLTRMFPESFDAIRLAQDVTGYVGDCSLIDGSPHNRAALVLADAAYRVAGGGAYPTCIHGPMLVLGVRANGESKGVPDAFLAQFLPALSGASS